MAVRSGRFTPRRLLHGLYVALIGGGIALNLAVGRPLFPSIVVGAWLGTAAAGLCLVGFVGYMLLAAFDLV